MEGVAEVWRAEDLEALHAEPCEPSWKNYRRGGMITRRDEDVLVSFGSDMRSSQRDRDASFERSGEEIAEVLLSCLKAINIPDSLWYLLYTIDEVLREDESRGAYFLRVVKRNGADFGGGGEHSKRWLEFYKPVLRVMAGTDNATDVPSLQARWRAISVLRVLLGSDGCDGEELLAAQQRQCIGEVLRTVARESRSLPDELAEVAPSSPARAALMLRAAAVQASLELLQRLLMLQRCREFFLAARGLELLVSAPLLCPRAPIYVDTPVDVQYRVMFALWMLSYDRSLGSRLRWETAQDESVTVYSASRPAAGFVRELVAILRRSEKTRVVRVGLLLLRNLLDTGLNQQMIDVGAVPVVETLSTKAWPDPDIHADAEHILAVLRRDLVALSNWGLYRQNILARDLSWSNPCHLDDAFWKANSRHFEEQDGAVLKALVALVGEQIEGPSSIGDLYSPTVLAVACHDMGQIVQAHPRGWKMLGKDAKAYLTTAMMSSDDGVKKAALLAIQRLMVASLGS
jgi:hypothetical protein